MLKASIAAATTTTKTIATGLPPELARPQASNVAETHNGCKKARSTLSSIKLSIPGLKFLAMKLGSLEWAAFVTGPTVVSLA